MGTKKNDSLLFESSIRYDTKKLWCSRMPCLPIMKFIIGKYGILDKNLLIYHSWSN